MNGCAFCRIINGHEAATLVRGWSDAVAFVPLDPVTSGHVLVVPRTHVDDATASPEVTAAVFGRAAELAGRYEAVNLLTSVGRAATQSVFHLHVHVIPRRAGDGLMLPWGTTGDPHEPHTCPGMAELAAELAVLRETG